MSKASYSDQEFFDCVRLANDAYQEGRDGKAFRILNRALKRYDKDIPAYIYFKYYELWEALEEEYEVDYEIEQMTDDELAARVSDAMQKNRKMKRKSKRFQREAKSIFNGYLRDRTSIADLKKKLTIFEKEHLSNEELTDETEEALIAIFRAYFYGKQVIRPKIVYLYDRFLRELFDCETMEDQLRNHAEKRLADDDAWPEPIRYAIKLSANPPSWGFVDIDPTIQENSSLKDLTEREQENTLAMVRALIHLEKGPRWEYALHDGCRIISNWLSLTEQYPQLMDQLVKRGREYKMKRKEHFKNEKWNQEQKLMRLPMSARERIVKIWNAWDDQWIDVAMGVE